MQLTHDDARPGRTARRARVVDAPVRVAVPVLSAVVLALAAALVTSLSGRPDWQVASAAGVALAVAAIGARRLLGNVAAGVTLKLARPYATDETLRLRAPEHGGTVEAQVVHVGLANTTLATWTGTPGMLVVPNTRLLRRAA